MRVGLPAIEHAIIYQRRWCAGIDLCHELKKRIDIIIRFRNGLKRTRLNGVGVFVFSSNTVFFCTVDGDYRCAARAPCSVGVYCWLLLLALVCWEDTFLREGCGHGFYRRPLLGFTSGIEKKNE